MILKVAKNELIKTFHHKQFYILLVFIIIMALFSTYIYSDIQNKIINGDVEANRYTEEVKESYINMNGSIFMGSFLTDFIYKSMIPYFLIFMVLFSIRTFSEDNTSGNLKFFILDYNNRVDIFYGKILYLFAIITIVVLINILLSFILGVLFFGVKGMTIKGLLSISSIYLLAIIPVLAFSSLAGVFSLMPGPSNVFIFIGIMLSVLVSVIDRFTISKYFSPIGILTKLIDVNVIDIRIFDLVKSNFVAFIYFGIAMVIGILSFRKKDWIY